jgi:hypothetical protein
MVDNILISPVERIRSSLNLDVETFSSMIGVSTKELESIEAGEKILKTETFQTMLNAGLITDRDSFTRAQIDFVADAKAVSRYSGDPARQVEAMIERRTRVRAY